MSYILWSPPKLSNVMFYYPWPCFLSFLLPKHANPFVVLRPLYLLFRLPSILPCL